jgi:hypothetical protein
MTCLPETEIAYHPLSFLDKAGRLFTWQGELYRGINPSEEARIAHLFSSELIPRLVERRLFVETELAPFRTEKYALVVHHRRIPFVSYPDEWCAPMFKDAVLALLDLLIELARAGHTVDDPHLWNIVFDGCHPLYVDLSSIVTSDTNKPWPFYREYSEDCLHPLLLIAEGRERLARALIHEGVPASEVGDEFQPGRDTIGAKLLRRVSALGSNRPRGSNADETYFCELREQIAAVSLPDASEFDVSQTRGLEGEAYRAVLRCIEERKPASILDVGDDNSAALAAAKMGTLTIAFRENADACGRLYREARDQQLPLQPLAIDFTQPSPERGLFGHRGQSATARFASDTVVALDLLPRLVFEYRRLSLEQIAVGLGMLSKRWVVIDYVAPRPELLQRGIDSSWYTLENLLAALRRNFRAVTTLHADPARTICLCEK